MSDPDMDDFIRACNEASREAKRSGISSSELAECLMKMASREFGDSPKLQEEYGTFAAFAKDTEFQIQEQDKEIRDALDQVEDRFDQEE
jgi:hypothetical protein